MRIQLPGEFNAQELLEAIRKVANFEQSSKKKWKLIEKASGSEIVASELGLKKTEPIIFDLSIAPEVLVERKKYFMFGPIVRYWSIGNANIFYLETVRLNRNYKSLGVNLVHFYALNQMGGCREKHDEDALPEADNRFAFETFSKRLINILKNGEEAVC